MHSSRTVIRAPHACRIVRAPLATSNRTISLLSPFAAPSPRLAGFPSHDFAFAAAAAAPLFRLLDDFALAAAQPLRAADVLHQHSALTTAVAAPRPTARSPAVAFASAPRFDVRELEGAYELRGELPGVEPRDLEVEFADAQTLVVRGRVETLTESGGGGGAVASATTMAEQQQQHSAAATAAETTADSDAASVHSSTAASYHRATVEDEAGTLSETSLSTPGEATPAGSNDGGSAEDTQAHAQVQTVAAAPAQQQQQQRQQQQQDHLYTF